MEGRRRARAPRPEAEEVNTRYFVSRDPDGSVSHLARVFDDGNALWGEFFIDGQWRAHESATDYLFEQSAQEEIDEAQAQTIVGLLTSRRQKPADQMTEPAKVTPRQEEVIREAFQQFFPGGGPQLPLPIPDHGSVSGNDWTVRYALNADENGDPRLDFFAENRFTESVIGQVSHEGEAVALDSYADHYSYDPEVEGDKTSAEQQMNQHNSAVRQLLQTRRLA